MKNLTPHVITICNQQGEVIKSFPNEEFTARAATNHIHVGVADGVNFYTRLLGDIVFAKKDGTAAYFVPQEGEIYIVPSLILAPFQDLLNKRGVGALAVAPAETIRNAQGQPVGTLGLVVAPNAPEEVVAKLIG